MTLRSNYEPGTSRWATRRAQWLALGLSDADMLKPKIAIVNTSSQLAIVLIRGSLCPDVGIVKLAVADDRRLEFSGPAKIFESAQQALDGVTAGQVEPGQVVVLRPRGEA